MLFVTSSMVTVFYHNIGRYPIQDFLYQEHSLLKYVYFVSGVIPGELLSELQNHHKFYRYQILQVSQTEPSRVIKGTPPFEDIQEGVFPIKKKVALAGQFFYSFSGLSFYVPLKPTEHQQTSANGNLLNCTGIMFTDSGKHGSDPTSHLKTSWNRLHYRLLWYVSTISKQFGTWLVLLFLLEIDYEVRCIFSPFLRSQLLQMEWCFRVHNFWMHLAFCLQDSQADEGIYLKIYWKLRKTYNINTT